MLQKEYVLGKVDCSAILQFRVAYQRFMHKWFPSVFCPSVHTMVNDMISTYTYEEILRLKLQQNSTFSFGRVYE
jgi:hypothetical protein